MNQKKEIKAEAFIRKNGDGLWDLYLPDRNQLINECLQTYKADIGNELQLVLTAKKKGKPKTPNKLGYFFVEILPKITFGLKDIGYWEIDEDAAYIFLCKRFNGTKTIAHHTTGEVLEQIPITLSELDDDQMWKFMDLCVKFASAELMVRIITPEEWKAQNGMQ